MRAILVNPFEKTITEVNANFNDFKVIQSFLATGKADGDKKVCLCAGPRLGREVHTYVDDEGYFRPNQAWFRIGGYQAPLAGYMLVLSSTEDGDERDLVPYVTVERMKGLVSYTDEQDAAATIPPVTVTGFKEFGGEPTSYNEYPVDITEKRPM